MRIAPKVVVLELNELSPILLDEFMAAGDLPNFRRLYKSSIVRTTDANEEPPYLEPWIQWPTVHFGVPRSQHGAFYLGDGRKYRGEGVASILSGAGVRVGVFGSMNLNYERLRGYYLPDPWDAAGKPSPSDLAVFSDFVSSQVKESSRDGARIGLQEALSFLRFMIFHGLTGATAFAIVRQLVDERLRPNLRWKRAMLQDFISYDVFESLNAKFHVDFATFFSNSVAHFQHYYWRDMSPEIFDRPLEDDADPSHRQAIREGYKRNDAIVGRAMRSYPESTIIFATALSQQPWKETEKCTYRPHDFKKFFDFASIDQATVEPLMAEEFRVAGPDPEAIAAKLRALTIESKPLIRAVVIEGAVHAQCAINDGDPRVLNSIVVGPAETTERFGNLFYRVTAMRSGRHHPIGAFWIRNGSPHRVEAEPVPLETIAPTILAMFDLPPYPFHSTPSQQETRQALSI